MSVREIVPDVVAQFRQELTNLVKTATDGEFDSRKFTEFVDGLKAVLASTGRHAFGKLVDLQDEAEDLFEHGGKAFRFKQVSTKEWLTPFGIVPVERRYYQPDSGGDGVSPLDLRCGMVDRFMTPDIEEATAFASADLSPTATHTLFAKLLPHAPSAKAIRRTVAKLGRWADEAQDAIENRIADEVPLPDGEVLVVSVDGVTVPLREPGRRTGRPAERPGVRDSDHTPTAWKEAGVATVSIYEPGDGDEKLPERLATKYFARMPESGMNALFAEKSAAVFDLVAERSFREMVVVLRRQTGAVERHRGRPALRQCHAGPRLLPRSRASLARRRGHLRQAAAPRRSVACQVSRTPARGPRRSQEPAPVHALPPQRAPAGI